VSGMTVFHGGPWDGQVWHSVPSMPSIAMLGAARPPRARWAAPADSPAEEQPVAGWYEKHGEPIPVVGGVVVIFVWRPAVTGPPPRRPELPAWELERLTKLMFQHPDLVGHG
jgi:hypothetical protein